MCGIVGYTGKKQAKNILLNSLEKLEYRGYDSAGIAVLDGTDIKYVKTQGRICKLRKATENINLDGCSGIAHTRWATHGTPTAKNSHPHFNTDKTIAVVHNGIIENYEELKTELSAKGYTFTTNTDTEVIPHLIDYYYNSSFIEAIFKTAQKLEGSYAVGVIHADEPHTIIAFKKGSPLIAGTKKDGNFIASDVSALIDETKNVYFIEDNEFAVLKSDGITFYNTEKNIINKKAQTVEYTNETIDKNGFEHFMLKEIYEQPKAVKNTVLEQLSKGTPIPAEVLKKINKIYIVACGTAYHSAIAGKYIIEKLAGISTETDVASEFRYKNPIINNKTLVVAVTQSGETADTLGAVKLARQKGAKVLAITNVEGSTVTRLADFTVYTNAGREIAVASTKAYLTQLASFYVLGIFLGEFTGYTSSAVIDNLKKQLLDIPEKLEQTLLLNKQVQTLAKKLCKEKNIFYIGRGLDYAVALEGALKLKETSYIVCEAYAAGELKHGPIALIEDNTVVIAVNTNPKRKTDNNIKEVASRGAKVISIVPEGYECSYENTVYIPKTDNLLYPLISSVPLQLLAYHIAVYKKCDVDKPKNLAKSVTVE